MVENAIEIRKPLTLSTWETISSLAPAIYKSRLFEVNSPEQAATIMLKGHELGLSFTASFEFIDIIKGKPALKPKGALALLHEHPECAGIKVEDVADSKGNPQACRVWMKRRNGFEYTVTFSMADAQKAGLVKKDSGWDKYPANMLRWRAIGFCADIVFPDVLGGLMRADDYGAELTEDGDVIEGSWSTADDGVQDVTENDVAQMLDVLMQEYGSEAVVKAAGGVPPATLQELEAVAFALAESKDEEEE